jgi:major membrane immunogen (membrane-anchored lipoprotein)
MKKVFLLLILAVATFTLFGCNSSEYKVDGEFLAYEVSVHRNAPMVTTVTVTIEDGEVVGFYIDARQGSATQTEGADTEEDTSDDVWSYSWNEKTKKELGDDYGMVENGGAIAEWDEQAALIEAYMLENGVDAVEVDAEEVITNITGVTIKDGGYTTLAAEALELAKEGKFQAVFCNNDDLVIATMMVDAKGVATDLVLDVLQGKPAQGTFEWAPKSKQELGLDYGMKDASEIGKEWYEQADAIAAYVLENGADSIQVDDTGHISNITGASVRNSGYSDVFALLFDFANYEV